MWSTPAYQTQRRRRKRLLSNTLSNFGRDATLSEEEDEPSVMTTPNVPEEVVGK